jgi:hypothetical protein
VRTFVFILFFISFANGANNQLLPVSTSDIQWKGQITATNVKLIHANSRYKCKKYLDIKKLKENKYRAKHYILKNTPICANDAYIAQSNKIKFNFGNIEIEKEGEVIRETDKYIKIKNLDGKIEKIYKDERGQ